jgi:N utilization substance protein B
VRRQSRELALQLLFQYEFDKDFQLVNTLNRFVSNFHVTSDVLEYGKPLLEGVLSNLEELDSVIQSASPHWKVMRMGMVDRNAIRIAVFELTHLTNEVPPKVAINEAIELGKKFGNTDSGSFINGILDQVVKSKGLMQNT